MADRARAGAIVRGSDVVADVVESPDVCVVGSGAGGAVVAARLAARGASVVVLEEGGAFAPQDMQMDEATAYPRLYQDHGQRATADLAITILQGRSVGGSTTVNWTTSFRTPDRVLAHWRAAYGSPLSAEVLAPHFAAVEARCAIHEAPPEDVNANNGVLWTGATRLGWAVARTRRNVAGCANLGYCGMGCPIGARQSADQTWIPDALAQGARVYANARAVLLRREGRRVAEVVAEVLDPATDRPTGRRVAVRPRTTVLAGGAINTPALLLRSGISLAGKVGARTFLHPVAAMIGFHPQRIDGWYGAPQSVASHQHAERGPGRVGFFLEAAPVHPMLAAMAAGGLAPGVHEAAMARLPHASALIALTVDGFLPREEGGTVSLRRDGRVRVDYPIRPEIWEALREGCKALARVHLAAGAESVVSLHDDPVEIRREADVAKLDAAPWEACRLSLFTAHQMGGCAFGADPEASVVTPELRLHAHDGVFVADGSVFPTSLGVNPQLSIMAVAHWAADHVAASLR